MAGIKIDPNAGYLYGIVEQTYGRRRNGRRQCRTEVSRCRKRQRMDWYDIMRRSTSWGDDLRELYGNVEILGRIRDGTLGQIFTDREHKSRSCDGEME